jgi:thiol-disulfide isomerase/thioredoxin
MSIKNLLIGLGVLIAVLVVVVNLPDSITDVRGTSDLPRIFYTESFDQSDDEYFVYFWNANCPACQQFDSDIVAAHERGIPIYVVDMADDRNASAWFQGEPGANNQQPQSASEIEVAGTPSLLRFVNGEVVGYATGIPDGNALFATFGQ